MLETWRCGSCAHEETVHVFDPSSEPILPPNLEPVFQIIGRWPNKPSAEQISEVQNAFPALRKMSVSMLLRKAVAKSDIDLGRFTESEIRNLDAMLVRAGMAITKTPVIRPKT